jgi:hypothetical protein
VKWVKLAEITQNTCDPGEMLQEISQGKRKMGRNGLLSSCLAIGNNIRIGLQELG